MSVFLKTLRIFSLKYLNNFMSKHTRFDNKMSEAAPLKNISCSIDAELNKLVYIDTIPYTTVTEGKAEVLFPSSHDVFYNPVQEFNRDMSVAVVKHFSKNTSQLLKRTSSKREKLTENPTGEKEEEGLQVLEALAASGLRSIRFAKEVPNLKQIVANDRDSQAFASMKRNIIHNQVEHLVEPCNEDATLLMYKHRQRKDKFDVVDLDPYGTASPFLDSAVQCVADGGLLMVTCTDMAVLCGNGVETCHAKYGAVSAKISSCHEMALRILLQSIESHANRYGRYIEPLMSLSVDFYVRVFVRLFTSPIAVKQSVCKLAMVYSCTGCTSFHLQPVGVKVKTEKGEKYSAGVGPPVNQKCNICGHSYKMSGPIWSSKLHDKEFLRILLATIKEENECYKTSSRMLGMISLLLEELEDVPLYYKAEHLTRTLHVPMPTLYQMRSAILNAGYRVSTSHACPTSLKTDAPPEIVWDISRTWANTQGGKKTYDLEPSKTIMSKVSSIAVSFEPHPDAEPESRSNHLLRFQMNPTPYWGPKSRATTSLLNGIEQEKSKKKQNKRKRKDLETEVVKKKNENDSEPSTLEATNQSS